MSETCRTTWPLLHGGPSLAALSRQDQQPLPEGKALPDELWASVSSLCSARGEQRELSQGSSHLQPRTQCLLSCRWATHLARGVEKPTATRQVTLC